jgi:hypothetical protein
VHKSLTYFYLAVDILRELHGFFPDGSGDFWNEIHMQRLAEKTYRSVLRDEYCFVKCCPDVDFYLKLCRIKKSTSQVLVLDSIAAQDMRPPYPWMR